MPSMCQMLISCLVHRRLTVSHPVKAWKNGNAVQMLELKLLAMTCTGIYYKCFPTPNVQVFTINASSLQTQSIVLEDWVLSCWRHKEWQYLNQQFLSSLGCVLSKLNVNQDSCIALFMIAWWKSILVKNSGTDDVFIKCIYKLFAFKNQGFHILCQQQKQFHFVFIPSSEALPISRKHSMANNSSTHTMSTHFSHTLLLTVGWISVP